MNGVYLNENLYVSPQITIDEIQEIKNLGFETLICNRPDGEDYNQTPFEEISKKANELNIKFIYQPIIGGTLNVDKALEFAKSLENSGKTFAYCRTGTRCTSLWALSQREKGQDINDILKICANAGYDMSGVLANL